MIEVKVPASSANIGPGFDALGMALNLYNTYRFQELRSGVEINGFENGYNNGENLVYTSMLKTFERIGYSPKGIRIDADARIPISRGLGSSAACILGGVMGANTLAGEPLSKEGIFKLAIDIEGHPDNIGPALYGGLVASIMEGDEVYYNHIDMAKGIKFVAIVPDFTLSTKLSREVLPAQIQYTDGVYNVGRVALLISALSNGRFDLIQYGLNDRLHQPYRGKLIKGFDEVIAKCQELESLGVYLSGAGPTIMAIIDENDKNFSKKIKEYLNSIDFNWDVEELDLNLSGAILKK